MMKKNLKQLHKEHLTHPELKNYYINYVFDEKAQEWKFTGYRCTKCGRSFKNPETLPQHVQRCPQIVNVPKYKETVIGVDVPVVTTQRKIWKPIDMNQNFSD